MCYWASGPETEGCSWARGHSGSERFCVCVCVCVCVSVSARARVQRWAHRREKNLWKQSHDSWGGSMCEACLFCIYPLWCSCVHCPFPRTREHSRRPHGPSSVRPLSCSKGAIVSIFTRDVPFLDILPSSFVGVGLRSFNSRIISWLTG